MGMYFIAGLIIIGILIALSIKQKRRFAAIQSPFPDTWDVILQKNFPIYQNLPQSLKDQLCRMIQIFVYDKMFEGCGGLVVTDEIKVTIAAQACLLLLNRKAPCYPKLRTILVYPSTYVAKEKESFTRDAESSSARLGESWSLGTVVLAWDSVKGDAINFKDGHNVTMHEFAHQLDQEDGDGDGIPILDNYSAYTTWAMTFSEEFQKLREKTFQGQKDVLYDYGATNPAEFFAVATETFFEKPEQLKEKHPELYEELKGFYRVDPMEWVS
ncbi:zinc-dependent peptidase [bacterium]